MRVLPLVRLEVWRALALPEQCPGGSGSATTTAFPETLYLLILKALGCEKAKASI
jgi:hypothetical protein